MKTDELIEALGRLKVQTGSLACLGCGHEHNCGVHGCALIREAVNQLIEQNGWVNIKERLPERGVPVLTGAPVWKHCGRGMIGRILSVA